jgi:O-antigen/teichoic acid export membrane protein
VTRASDAPAASTASSGEHERRLAINYLTRQAAQVVGIVVGLGITTLLARRLSLSELGVYALLLSLTSYLIVLQAVIEPSAIKAIAEARDQADRDHAFSTTLVVYSAAGVVGAAVVLGLGAIFLQIWSIPEHLRADAWRGVVALTVMTLLSWPTRVFYDVLRGEQLFPLAAVTEVIALLLSAAAVAILVLLNASLWLIVLAVATGSLIIGLTSAAIVAAKGLPYRFRRAALTRAGTRSFLSLSAYYFLAGVADIVIYSLDRTILGAFRSARIVGLYEGPIRAHNFVRDVQATLVSPVLPAAARFRSVHDVERLRELLLRGSRYLVAVVTPVAVTLVVLARPLLVAWLGPKFAPADLALSILVGYWIIYANTSVGWSMLVAIGQIRKFALFAGAVAGLNLALSLALAPILGLNGVVLGTAIPYVLGFPVFLRLTLPEFGVRTRDFAREVWLPAYSTALAVGGGLAAVRFSFDLETIPFSFAAAAAAVLTYWAIYYIVWLRPNERILVRDLVRRFAHR